VGPVLVAGPFVATIVAALEGAVVVAGLSAIGAGLYSLGIPKNTVLRYESALKADKFLVAVHGTGDEVKKAQDILATAGSGDVAIYSTPPVEEPVHA
jgi:hypothetical protein